MSVINPNDKAAYLTNTDGSFKLDKLGRKRHINQNEYAQFGNRNGRLKGTGEGINRALTIRMTNEMYDELNKKAKGKLAAKVREYIEWGLENDS